MEIKWQDFINRFTKWIIAHGPSILVALLVLFVGFWVIRILGGWLKRIFSKKSFNPSLSYFLQNLIVISLQIFLLLGAFQIAGVQLTFLTAIIAGLSVAAGLALSGTLQNFVCGVLILLLRPFRVTDNIITQGQEGIVQSIQLFYTIVLTYDNKTIIIPNGQLSNNVVINLSREGKRRMDILLKFPYTVDASALKSAVHETITKIKGVLKDPEVRIGISSLEADKFELSIEIWAPAHGFKDMRLLVQEQLMNDLMAKGMLGPEKKA